MYKYEKIFRFFKYFNFYWGSVAACSDKTDSSVTNPTPPESENPGNIDPGEQNLHSIIINTDLGVLNSNEEAVILSALGKENNFVPYFNDWMIEITNIKSDSAEAVSYIYPGESVALIFKIVNPLFQNLGLVQVLENSTQDDLGFYLYDDGNVEPLRDLSKSLNSVWNSLTDTYYNFYIGDTGYESQPNSGQIVWIAEDELENYKIDSNQHQVLKFYYDDGETSNSEMEWTIAYDVVYGDSFKILQAVWL